MLELIGRFHPLLVHLPIGILLIASVFYFLSAKEKYASLKFAVIVSLFLGMLAAIVGILFHHPKQRVMINGVTNAIKSISRGEYNVSLNLEKFRDVNRGEIKKIIDSFNNMAVSLEQVEKMRQEFISNVSHEIQSPLTSIKGFAKVLQNENLPTEERMQYLSIIEYESNRLSKLSDNLLKLTSLETQDQPLDKAMFSLNSQLMYSILSCEPQILEKDINLSVNLNKVDIVGFLTNKGQLKK